MLCVPPIPVELEDNLKQIAALTFCLLVVGEPLGCELFWDSALRLWLSWKKRATTSLPSSGSSSFIQRLQNRVEAEHCPGLLDIRSGLPVREPPDFTLFQGLNCPGSWQEAIKVQPEKIMSQDRGYGPVVRAALCQRTDVCPQTLRKVGWLSYRLCCSLETRLGRSPVLRKDSVEAVGMQGLLAVSRQL